MFEALALTLALIQNTPQPIPTPQTLPTIWLATPHAQIHVQVAHTKQQRERGLMGIHKLATHTGMLFVFQTDAPIEFWMKDTLVPLDMVFIGKNGVIRTVFANIHAVSPNTPDDRIPRRDGIAKYVLELPAGEAARDGLAYGVHISRLPLAIVVRHTK